MNFIRRTSQTLSTALFVTLISATAMARHHGGSGNGGGYDPQPAPVQSNPGQVVEQPSSGGSEPCMSNGQALPVMNEQALQWRSSEASGFKSRALISGTVDEVFPDATGHRHFSIRIGQGAEDHIEVIYNESFGAMPEPQAGESVEACGDFIVATAQNNGYPPSPDGAIIHWVHRSNSSNHDSGFVILNGQVYGNASGGRGN
jgi:hypothetical protein